MSCTEITPLLGKWYDDELDANAARRVELHIADCETCAAEVESWRAVDRLLDLEVDVGDLCTFVMKAVRHDASRGGAWWLRVAASAVIAAGLGSVGGSLVAAPDAKPGRVVVADADASLAVLEATFTTSSVAGIDALVEDYRSLAAGGRSR